MLFFILYTFIITCSLILTRGTFIPKSDDPGLIDRAIQQMNLSPDWSPMYLDWVRFINWLRDFIGFNGAFNDSTALVYAILFIIAVIFLALSTFIALFIISKSNRTTFFLSLLLFFSPVSPIVGHFADLPSSIIIYYALSFFLIGISIVVCFENKIFSVLAVLCFVIASLFRPEFFASVVFIVLYFAWIFYPKIKRLNLKNALILVLVLGITILLYHHYGLPIPSSGRSVLAFEQHFAVRYCENYKNICIALDINQWTDWKEILPLSFSVYDQKITLFNLFINNPTAVITHISVNFIQAAADIISLGFFIPLFIFNPIVWKLIGLIMGFLAVIFLVKQGIHYKKSVFLVHYSNISAMIIFSCIPSILSAILFFPRIHYLAMIVYVLLILVCPVKLKGCRSFGTTLKERHLN